MLGGKRNVVTYVLEYTEICANSKWKLLYKIIQNDYSTSIFVFLNKQKKLPGKVNTSVKEWLKQNWIIWGVQLLKWYEFLLICNNFQVIHLFDEASNDLFKGIHLFWVTRNGSVITSASGCGTANKDETRSTMTGICLPAVCKAVILK